MRLLKRIIASTLIAILLVACVTMPATAHEVDPAHPLRFNDRNSKSGPELHVYYKDMRAEGAPAHYYDCALSAIKAWDGFSKVTDGGCNQLTPTNKNISFSCSATVWNDLAISSTTLAVTMAYDTAGNNLYINGMANTTGRIKIAHIFMHPTGGVFHLGTTDETTIKNRIQKTMVHEMGHAMGLGHPDRPDYSPISSSTYSVMRQKFPDQVKSGTTPQTHEKTDLNNMY